MKTADDIIKKYLHFSGERNINDFGEFLKVARQIKLKYPKESEEYTLIEYVETKLIKGIGLCAWYGKIHAIIDEQSKGDIVQILKDQGLLKGASKAPLKKRPSKKVRKPKVKRLAKKKATKKSLGKLVDHGQVAPRGKSDVYWRRQGIEVVFLPNDAKVRTGEKIPDTYKYADVRFIEQYYSLKAIEFGNWLSQQDRLNYLAGLGLALFDLHKAIRFNPKQISIKNRLSVAFGARGRGKALAHFEPGFFAINLTRYSRPKKVTARPRNFNRVNMILQDGGVGSFAHEYGHALDYYGGLHIEKGDTFSLSGDDSIDPTPDSVLLKKNTLKGLMEKLLYKIIWKNNKVHTAYYTRLRKAAKTDYYIQRNEIFARAFEVYVQYKLLKQKHKNVFLNKSKYDQAFYLSIAEMRNVEKEFDALMSALKKHL